MISSETILQCFRENKSEIIEGVVKNHFAEINKLILLRTDNPDENKYLEDTLYYLDYLKQALLFETPILFFDYISSVYNCLEGLKISPFYAIQSLKILREELPQHFPPELLEKIRWLINGAIEQLKIPCVAKPSYLKSNQPHFELAKKYMESLLQGESEKGKEFIQKAIDQGVPVKEIYLHVFEPVQYEIGRLWQMNSISVAEEHYCTAATQLIMAQCYPYIFKGDKNGLTLVAACIGDNLHELGIRMVADFFEMERWNTYYLGANVPDESLIKILRDKKPQLFALSVTIPLQLEKASFLIQKIKSDEQLKSIKVMVGGYAFNLDPNLWKKIGADGYAKNAEESIKIAQQLFN